MDSLDRIRLSQSDSTIDAVAGMPVIPFESNPVQSGAAVELQERGVGSSLLIWFCEALLFDWNRHLVESVGHCHV
jgi:hypothetical protein